jgi:hypothetical protein
VVDGWGSWNFTLNNPIPWRIERKIVWSSFPSFYRSAYLFGTFCGWFVCVLCWVCWRVSGCVEFSRTLRDLFPSFHLLNIMKRSSPASFEKRKQVCTHIIASAIIAIVYWWFRKNQAKHIYEYLHTYLWIM